MSHHRVFYLSLIHVSLLMGLCGCQQKQDNSDASPSPSAAANSPAPAPESPPAPAAANPALSVVAVTVGNKAEGNQSVADLATLGVNDPILVSIKTAGVVNQANLGAKLTFQDGQEAGQKTVSITNTHDQDVTTITFTKPGGWPVGNYQVTVLLNSNPVDPPKQIHIQ